MLQKLFFALSLLLGLSLISPVTGAETETEQPGSSAWRQKVNQSLDKVESQINDIEEKSKKLSASARKEWDKTLADLKTHRDQLKQDLKSEKAQAKDKAEDYWSRIKAALSELEKGASAAAQKIKGEKK